MNILRMPSAPPSNSNPSPANSPKRGRRTEDLGIVHAKSQDGLFTWSYTNNLTLQQHSDILITGLDPFLAHSVLSHIVYLVSLGHIFRDGDACGSLLPHLTCIFRTMSPSSAGLLMPRARSWNLHARVLQLVYPDNKNRLPWDPHYNQSWRQVQPLFLTGRPLGEIECSFLHAAMRRPLPGDRRRPQVIPDFNLLREHEDD